MISQALAIKEDKTQTLMKPVATPQELIGYHESIAKIIREALKDGTDFGVIPGTKKPSLYKAGAERVNIAFGTHPEYELVEKEANHDRENSYSYYDKYKKQQQTGTSFGLYRYVYKCKIMKLDGSCIGEAEGSCSTLEQKYISRPRDMENTVVKMAQKRAFVAATLHAFGLSDRFTQDAEDLHTHDIQAEIVDDIPQPKAPLPFNCAEPKCLEWLETKLKELKISADCFDDIAVALDKKPWTKEEFDLVVKKYLEPKE